MQGLGFAIAGNVWLAADQTKRKMRKVRRRLRTYFRSRGWM